MKLCTIPECESPHIANGYCNRHYQRWRKYGDPYFVKKNPGNRKPRPRQAVRTCIGCGLTGEVVLFRPGRNRCRPCDNAYKMQWLAKNPDKRAAILERGRDRQRSYEQRRRAIRAGQDPDLIQEYREAHDGLCEICGKPPAGKRAVLYIDHDHATGSFRGLICSTCNSGLGHFKDDPEALRAAIAYLERGPINLADLAHLAPNQDG